MKRILITLCLTIALFATDAQEIRLVKVIDTASIADAQKDIRLGVMLEQAGIGCIAGCALFLGTGIAIAPNESTANSLNSGSGIKTSTVCYIIGGIVGGVGLVLDGVGLNSLIEGNNILKDKGAKKVSFYQGNYGVGVAFNF